MQINRLTIKDLRKIIGKSNKQKLSKKLTGVVGGGGVVKLGVVVLPPDGFFVVVVTFAF
jgi:hypothetical protein